jgi:hypothetical protein
VLLWIHEAAPTLCRIAIHDASPLITLTTLQRIILLYQRSLEPEGAYLPSATRNSGRFLQVREIQCTATTPHITVAQLAASGLTSPSADSEITMRYGARIQATDFMVRDCIMDCGLVQV